MGKAVVAAIRDAGFKKGYIIARNEANGRASSYLGQVTPVDTMLSDSNTGLSGSLQKFFTSLPATPRPSRTPHR